MRLSHAIDGFHLYFITSGKSKSTADLYQIYLTRFSEFFEDPEVDQITEKMVMEFFAFMQTEYIPRRSSGNAEPLAMSSLMKVRNALRAFFEWAEEYEVIDKKNRPDRKLKTFKVTAEEVRPFSEDEVKALLKAAEYTKITSPSNRKPFVMKRRTAKRDIALILILLDTGLRVSELCRLQVKDINLKNGEVNAAKFGTGIKSKGRTVYLGTGTRNALWSYLASRGEPGPNEPLLVSERRGPMSRGSVQSLLYDLGDKAGVPDCHPHRFRHTFAVMYLRNGGDIYTLQHILGHATLDMVKVYLQLAESDSAEAHRKASPVDNLKR